WRDGDTARLTKAWNGAGYGCRRRIDDLDLAIDDIELTAIWRDCHSLRAIRKRNRRANYSIRARVDDPHLAIARVCNIQILAEDNGRGCKYKPQGETQPSSRSLRYKQRRTNEAKFHEVLLLANC